MKCTKYLLSLAMSICFVFVVNAQTGDYMVHTIKNGETLSALAKKYNTTVGDIMRLNGMNSKSILKLGQQVKIPIKSNDVAVKDTTHHTVKVNVITQETVPEVAVKPENSVTYKVQPKETLYGIAKKNHVYVSQLKKWNNLKDDNIKTGQVLIVGTQPEKPAAQTLPPEVIVKPGRPDNDPNQPKTKPTVKVTEEKPKPTAPVEEQTAPVTNAPKEGYFKNEYKKNGQEATGTAATFKSASGWADKKFYVLMNKVDAGTIVRVSSNNKTIYAKVLGALPDIKEDNGLLLRLSNAATSALGVADKFDVIVNY
jgi:LysM repeat protein